MGKKRVLITGAGGLIGQVLLESLASSYEVVGIDARRVRGVKRVDMTRQRDADRAMAGADVVIDLASSHWQRPWDVVLRNNIPAAWTTLEAARRQGVGRVIYASSNHVTGMYERDQPFSRVAAGDYGDLKPVEMRRITTTMPVRPDTPYGVGKTLGEAAARYYSDEYGLSVLCLRIGSFTRANRPSSSRHFATLITHADMTRLVRCCIEAPADVSFGIYYGVSRNTWRIWDIDDAARAVGYQPRDDAEQWRNSVAEPPARDPLKWLVRKFPRARNADADWFD